MFLVSHIIIVTGLCADATSLVAVFKAKRVVYPYLLPKLILAYNRFLTIFDFSCRTGKK